MKTLYLRIYLTVVAVLLLFALFSGWLLQRNLEHERGRFERVAGERMQAWGELLQGALPPPDSTPEEQAAALLEWAQRLRLPLALDGTDGQRIVTSPGYERAQSAWAARPPARVGSPGIERRTPVRLVLSDGRTLWVLRPPLLRAPDEAGPPGGGPGRGPGMRQGPPGGSPGLLVLGGGESPWFVRGTGLVITLAVLFLAVAAGAFPVVRRLTRRLEALKQGVEAFGAGDLGRRVDAGGRDEVAAVAASFNQAAQRIESLLQANRALLANASHELRSPLARLKMAVSLHEEARDEAGRATLRAEIERNIGELDALVEEVLLASRLEARPDPAREPVDLLGLAAEEAARAEAELEARDADKTSFATRGDDRLLRRALRNLLENARRYGGPQAPVLSLARSADGGFEIAVSDRGPGVPPEQRERIFEPFYRLPGHAERAGGVGLGLSLVRQIALLHGGTVRCEARESGAGSRFVISLPPAPGA
ncbi:sensor histidine kinase [Rivibacter subsaxonicus]|uniref:histidine kinase n=1 Tax=Rivibacter subsaxonicus TaxID=457575 RepID=A0A4Q7W0E5_9BURK|nr:HAMP domain-containing sensor histidine kinase [Rivibacter subsaxonicus]RZU02684.1 signal transduction histidine kinase [Rivibacter subsaxonicus]